MAGGCWFENAAEQAPGHCRNRSPWSGEHTRPACRFGRLARTIRTALGGTPRAAGGTPALPGPTQSKPKQACMSHSVNKRRAVTKAASENGPFGSSEEAASVTVDLALGERTSPDLARVRGRLAVGRAAGP